MNIFWLVSLLLLVIAVAFVVRPLLTKNSDPEGNSEVSRAYVWVCITVVFMVIITVGIYAKTGNWRPYPDEQMTTQSESVHGTDTKKIQQLLEQIKTQPDNTSLLIDLGAAYVAVESFQKAIESYQRAYDMTNGQDLNAITGWVEALVLSDPNSVNGKAASLVEEALILNPKHPRALWYGGLIALQMQNPKVARDRFSVMLSLNPPESIRQLLERQINELDAQLSGSSQSAVANLGEAKSDNHSRAISVEVKISGALKNKLKEPMVLFVLARQPNQSGPPLAVERHQSSELPIKIKLDESDAMLPSRTINHVDEVQVVARLSASGSPTEQSGDYYGVANYSFVKQGSQGVLSIEINQRVP